MRLKGHIWLWSISRCCDVARSWCPSWKCGQKRVSVSCDVSKSCDHLLEMGLKILWHRKILIHIFLYFREGHQDLATSKILKSWNPGHSKNWYFCFVFCLSGHAKFVQTSHINFVLPDHFKAAKICLTPSFLLNVRNALDVTISKQFLELLSSIGKWVVHIDENFQNLFFLW